MSALGLGHAFSLALLGLTFWHVRVAALLSCVGSFPSLAESWLKPMCAHTSPRAHACREREWTRSEVEVEPR